MSKSANTHNIVILGSSYAGLGVAHGLLKAIPNLTRQNGTSYKVTMISNSTHFWYSVGTPRAVLKPFPKDIMDSFIPISKGFDKYPAGQFEFIHAEVTGLAPGERQVIYKLKDDKAEIVSDITTTSYDTLVLATGSKGPSPIYSYHGSHIPTLEAYKDTHARLPSAKTVMIVGGGTAGVETAGEVGHLHGKHASSRKDITILSGHDRLLTGLRPAISKRAQEILTDMGVKVEHNIRLQDTKKLPNGSTEVTLSDNSTRTIDILMVATGRHPASDFLPRDLLDAKGRVLVDDYLRTQTHREIYVVGDLASLSPGGLLHMNNAVPCAVGNIVAALGGKGNGKVFKELTKKETQFVPVGPNTGVGAAFGWWIPGAMIRLIKGKNFMFPKAMETVMG